jgi:hypothetical protein
MDMRDVDVHFYSGASKEDFMLKRSVAQTKE